jgi:DNA invertase Pin-like site-specific DNA recombinase
MKVGYARVSSLGQSLDTQFEKLTAFGCEKIFQEKRSGASRDAREALSSALEFCRDGDVLVATKLDRLARSMFDLQEITKTLERKGVDFIVLDQSIDTTTPAGRLTFHLLGAVAEFERDLIAERRNEGIDKAKARGVKFGRRDKLTETQIEELRAAYGAGETRQALMQRFGISKSTFYRLCPGGRVDGHGASEKEKG